MSGITLIGIQIKSLTNSYYISHLKELLLQLMLHMEFKQTNTNETNDVGMELTGDVALVEDVLFAVYLPFRAANLAARSS